jgi:hypothetical protein
MHSSANMCVRQRLTERAGHLLVIPIMNLLEEFYATILCFPVRLLSYFSFFDLEFEGSDPNRTPSRLLFLDNTNV